MNEKIAKYLENPDCLYHAKQFLLDHFKKTYTINPEEGLMTINRNYGETPLGKQYLDLQK